MGYPIQCVPLWCKLANITNINHSYKPTTNSYKRTSTNSYKTMFVREISSINHSFSASDVWQPTLSNGGPHPVDRRPWSQQKTPGGLGLGQIFPGFSQGSVEKPPWNMGAFGGFRCSCPIFRNEMMVELIEFLLLHGNGSGVEKTIPPMTLWSLQLFSIFPGNTNPMMGKKTHGTLLKDGCWSMSLCEFTVGTLLRIWKVKWSSLYIFIFQARLWTYYIHVVWVWITILGFRCHVQLPEGFEHIKRGELVSWETIRTTHRDLTNSNINDIEGITVKNCWLLVCASFFEETDFKCRGLAPSTGWANPIVSLRMPCFWSLVTLSVTSMLVRWLHHQSLHGWSIV